MGPATKAHARVSVVLVLLVPLLASCGSDKSSSTEAGSTSAPVGKPTAEEPTGSLSSEEYRLMRAAYLKVKQADEARGVQKSLKLARAACDSLSRAPTPLIEANHNECVATIEFLDELAGLLKEVAGCEGPRQEISTSSCLSRPLQAVATKTRTAVEDAKATNRALTQREINGRCFRAIGTPKRDLRSASRIATTADAFDKAIQTGDPAGVKRAAKDFEAAVKRFSSSPSGAPLRLLRACRKP